MSREFSNQQTWNWLRRVNYLQNRPCRIIASCIFIPICTPREFNPFFPHFLPKRKPIGHYYTSRHFTPRRHYCTGQSSIGGRRNIGPYPNSAAIRCPIGVWTANCASLSRLDFNYSKRQSIDSGLSMKRLYASVFLVACHFLANGRLAAAGGT